jgi:hypothetical protein
VRSMSISRGFERGGSGSAAAPSCNPLFSTAFALMLILLAILAVPTHASNLDEADYPTQYEVIVTSRVGSFMIGNFCTMDY